MLLLVLSFVHFFLNMYFSSLKFKCIGSTYITHSWTYLTNRCKRLKLKRILSQPSPKIQNANYLKCEPAIDNQPMTFQTVSQFTSLTLMQYIQRTHASCAQSSKSIRIPLNVCTPACVVCGMYMFVYTVYAYKMQQYTQAE